MILHYCQGCLCVGVCTLSFSILKELVEIPTAHSAFSHSDHISMLWRTDSCSWGIQIEDRPSSTKEYIVWWPTSFDNSLIKKIKVTHCTLNLNFTYINVSYFNLCQEDFTVQAYRVQYLQIISNFLFYFLWCFKVKCLPKEANERRHLNSAPPSHVTGWLTLLDCRDCWEVLPHQSLSVSTDMAIHIWVSEPGSSLTG